MTVADGDARVRLGRMLRDRRERDLGYTNLAKFTRDRGGGSGEGGIDRRTLWNLETGRPVSPVTLLAADAMYGLENGSCQACLDGGELRPIPDAGYLAGLDPEDAQAVRELVARLRDKAGRRRAR